MLTSYRLKAVAKVIVSNVDKHSVDGERRVKLCNYTDVYNHTSIDASLNFMQSTASEEQIRRFGLQFGDVIITKDSESPSDIAVPALVTENVPELVCGYHLAILRPNMKIVDSRFLLRVLQAKATQTYFTTAANGITRYGLTYYSLKNAPILLPTLSVQEKVADFLDRETAEADALVAKYERLIELLEEKRVALITETVTRGLDPNVPMKDSGNEWNGEIPVHWEAKPLKRVAKRLSVGIVIEPSQYFSLKGKPFIHGNNIGKGTLLLEDVKRISDADSELNSKSRLSAGDLVTMRVGEPGRTAVVSEACEGGNCASVILIKGAPTFNSHWLRFLLNSGPLRTQIQLGQNGSAQQVLNVGIAVNLALPVPPLGEQGQIANYLLEIEKQNDRAISHVLKAIALVKEHRSALITAVVTGEINTGRVHSQKRAVGV